MTHVLRIAHLKIAHHVCNPEVGKREGNPITPSVLMHIKHQQLFFQDGLHSLYDVIARG